MEKRVIEAAMRAAIGAATQPGIRTRRNPRVGCTLLTADGIPLVTSAHHGPGTLHAEAAAVQILREQNQLAKVRGGIAVVTLEPCQHTGNTPPCTDALLAAGVAEVFFGVADPNPVAAGGGEFLAQHGVRVESGVLESECRAVDPRWLTSAALGRPHVTWKYAATLDGRTAAADGSSQWISGKASRDVVHQLRAAHDAVVVGTGTALADNPRLTVRGRFDEPLPRSMQPVRVVVGERDIPAGFHLHDESAQTLFIAERNPLEVLRLLWDEGVRRVFLEGGPEVAAAFVEAGCVDEIHAFIAPMVLGSGSPVIADVGVGSLVDAVRWQVESVAAVGPDVHVVLAPGQPELEV